LPVAAFLVGEYGAPDVIGEVPFQAAGCGSGTFAFVDFLVVVRAAGAGGIRV